MTIINVSVSLLRGGCSSSSIELSLNSFDKVILSKLKEPLKLILMDLLIYLMYTSGPHNNVLRYILIN